MNSSSRSTTLDVQICVNSLPPFFVARPPLSAVSNQICRSHVRKKHQRPQLFPSMRFSYLSGRGIECPAFKLLPEQRLWRMAFSLSGGHCNSRSFQLYAAVTGTQCVKKVGKPESVFAIDDEDFDSTFLVSESLSRSGPSAAAPADETTGASAAAPADETTGASAAAPADETAGASAAATADETTGASAAAPADETVDFSAAAPADGTAGASAAASVPAEETLGFFALV
nr:hypothetical protein Iba_chr12bCG12790 [Ipomoea batatas]